MPLWAVLFTLILVLFGLSAHASTPAGEGRAPVELRALGGALLETSSHGEADLGVRAGPWSAELLTDTLQLAWSPGFDRGRGWVLLRAEGGAAGLMITPWTDGRLDPERALTASYLGPEVGYLRYLPAGLYAGATARGQVWTFGETETTTRVVPGPAWVGGARVIGGYYQGFWSGELRAGADGVRPMDPDEASAGAGEAFYGAPVQWALDGGAAWRPRWRVSPRMELRGGLSEGRGELGATRIGGSMPYGVPLAGAGWFELWGRQYAVGRLGLFVGSPDAAPGSGAGAEVVEIPEDRRVRARGGLVVDGALIGSVLPGPDCGSLPNCTVAMDTDLPVGGVGLNLGLRVRRSWLVTEVATATLPRDQRWPVTVMFRLGLDWKPLGRSALNSAPADGS